MLCAYWVCFTFEVLVVVKLMINVFTQAAESAVSFSIHLIVGFLDI